MKRGKAVTHRALGAGARSQASRLRWWAERSQRFAGRRLRRVLWFAAESRPTPQVRGWTGRGEASLSDRAGGGDPHRSLASPVRSPSPVFGHWPASRSLACIGRRRPGIARVGGGVARYSWRRGALGSSRAAITGWRLLRPAAWPVPSRRCRIGLLAIDPRRRVGLRGQPAVLLADHAGSLCLHAPRAERTATDVETVRAQPARRESSRTSGAAVKSLLLAVKPASGLLRASVMWSRAPPVMDGAGSGDLGRGVERRGCARPTRSRLDRSRGARCDQLAHQRREDVCRAVESRPRFCTAQEDVAAAGSENRVVSEELNRVSSRLALAVLDRGAFYAPRRATSRALPSTKRPLPSFATALLTTPTLRSTSTSAAVRICAASPLARNQHRWRMHAACVMRTPDDDAPRFRSRHLHLDLRFRIVDRRLQRRHAPHPRPIHIVEVIASRRST